MAASAKDSGKPAVTLSASTRLKGVLRFKRTLCVMGRFEGTIDAEGSLVVGKGAVVECDRVHANSVTVHGFVKARIHADDKVDLMDGGEIHGDVYTSRLRIADGGMFEGRCSMIDADNAADLFSLPASELKAVLRSKPAPVPDTDTDADEADGAKSADKADASAVDPDADEADADAQESVNQTEADGE